MAEKPKSKVKPVGGPAAFAEAAECLRTMAHQVRLRMVQLLLHGRYTVGELPDSQIIIVHESAKQDGMLIATMPWNQCKDESCSA